MAQTVWSTDRPDSDDPQPEGFIVVRFRVEPDGDGFFVGHCLEFEVSSFGSTVDEAFKATMEATEAYLETLDMIGEREKVFADRGVIVYPNVPGDELEFTVSAHAGEFITPQRLALA